jgi:hypothetical protein
VPTTSDLLALRGVAQRSTSYSFELVDKDERRIGDLHPMAAEQTPTITHDSSRGVMRDMANFNLTPQDQAAVNTLTDRVRPSMLLEDGATFPLGVFLFLDASNPRYSYGSPLAASLVDKGILLDQPIEHSVSLAAGQMVRTLIVNLLADIDIASTVEGSASVLANPLSWPAGVSRLRVISDLCTAGGFLPPFFNHAGVCNVVAPANLDELTGITGHAFAPRTPVIDYADGSNIYAASPVSTNDLLTAPNRYIVIGNDVNAQPVVGVYDVPAGAPYSAYARGFVVAKVIDQQGIANKAAADYAAKAYGIAQQVHEYVTFAGPPDARHDGFSIVTFDGLRWLEQSWSLPLTAVGPMTHTLRRVYL